MPAEDGERDSGSEKRVFWKRDLFRKVHFLEIVENLEILEILENPQTVENKGEIRPFSRDSRESRDCRDSREFSSEKAPFVMTPFSSPERQSLKPSWQSRLYVCYAGKTEHNERAPAKIHWKVLLAAFLWGMGLWMHGPGLVLKSPRKNHAFTLCLQHCSYVCTYML